jgi:hypothetical protein
MNPNPILKVRKPPCGLCQRGAPYDGPFDPERQCRLCWLYTHNPHIGFVGGSPEAPQGGNVATLQDLPCPSG